MAKFLKKGNLVTYGISMEPKDKVGSEEWHGQCDILEWLNAQRSTGVRINGFNHNRRKCIDAVRQYRKFNTIEYAEVNVSKSYAEFLVEHNWVGATNSVIAGLQHLLNFKYSQLHPEDTQLRTYDIKSVIWVDEVIDALQLPVKYLHAVKADINNCAILSKMSPDFIDYDTIEVTFMLERLFWSLRNYMTGQPFEYKRFITNDEKWARAAMYYDKCNDRHKKSVCYVRGILSILTEITPNTKYPTVYAYKDFIDKVKTGAGISQGDSHVILYESNVWRFVLYDSDSVKYDYSAIAEDWYWALKLRVQNGNKNIPLPKVTINIPEDAALAESEKYRSDYSRALLKGDNDRAGYALLNAIIKGIDKIVRNREHWWLSAIESPTNEEWVSYTITSSNLSEEFKDFIKERINYWKACKTGDVKYDIDTLTVLDKDYCKVVELIMKNNKCDSDEGLSEECLLEQFYPKRDAYDKFSYPSEDEEVEEVAEVKYTEEQLEYAKYLLRGTGLDESEVGSYLDKAYNGVPTLVKQKSDDVSLAVMEYLPLWVNLVTSKPCISFEEWKNRKEC